MEDLEQKDFEMLLLARRLSKYCKERKCEGCIFRTKIVENDTPLDTCKIACDYPGAWDV